MPVVAIHVYAIISAIGVNKDHGPMMYMHTYVGTYVCMTKDNISVDST